jgi:hypothetical protein
MRVLFGEIDVDGWQPVYAGGVLLGWLHYCRALCWSGEAWVVRPSGGGSSSLHRSRTDAVEHLLDLTGALQ